MQFGGTFKKNGYQNLLRRPIEYMTLTSVLRLLLLIFAGLLCVASPNLASGDVLIDNGDPGTEYTSTWAISSGSSPYGDDSLWARDGATYTWSMDSQPAGTYEVLMWWSGYPTRADSVKVEIYHGGGTTNITVDQSQNPGFWNSLGLYYFEGVGSVRIIAAYGDMVSTCADAVWFRYISSNTPPSAVIDSIDPNPADPGEQVQFIGHGTDSEGPIAAYEWSSSLEGVISFEPTFNTSTLSEGSHLISFRVEDEDGVWSVPDERALVIGSAPTEFIIDNEDPQASWTGIWRLSGGAEPYGSDSVWSRDGATYTWSFTPAQSGEYEVSMWWTTWPSRSDSVPVSIIHSGGTDTITINQQENWGQWNSLGTFFFEEGTAYSVTITAQPGPSSTCADAVKFTLLSANMKPTAIIDSVTPNPAEPGEEISFVGHGEDTDGDIEAYKWESTLDGVLSESPSFVTNGLSEGNHVIAFSVKDNEGAWSEPATTTLRVGNPPNSIPTAVIDSVSPNPADLGQSVSFSGHGEDSDGTIISYRWESDLDGLLSVQPEFATTELSQGTHTITLVVIDDLGAESAPATETVTVQNVPTVVDNGDAETSFTGTWRISGGAEPYGSDSVWSRDGATYTWTFTPTVSSYYEVYMWWTEWPSRSADVPVAIMNSDGTSTVYINQQENGGQWNILGTFFFEEGTTYSVTITAQPGLSSTCADAVRFVRVSQPPETPPAANFSADRTYGGVPATIQFYDQSTGNPTEWLWAFGDGTTSTEKNPSHTYERAGTFTVSLTVTNAYGSHSETKEAFISIYAATENIYLCDGYSYNALFLPRCYKVLEDLGATETTGVWIYENPDKGVTYYIYSVHDPKAMESVLKEEGAHIIFNGHSNFGLGASFGSYQEVSRQEIDDIYYVDDDRFTNYSTDMVSVKIDGMKWGQAYPNWNPIFKDGTSAIMPYDFDEGLPPYNYYITYTIPGDPQVYLVELSDGRYLERFPDSNTPAWYSPDGSQPDPILNQEYFVVNPDDEFNRCEFIGDWPIAKVPGAGFMGDAGYLGYNYQYHAPGSGDNKAVFTVVVKFPGYYSVLASWFPDSGNATNARYTISHALGTDTVTVDQRETQLMNPLGVYYFGKGAYTIEINDDADGTVIADSVILKSTEDPSAILQAEFGADVLTGEAPLTVHFGDYSSVYIDGDFEAEIVAWEWDFGDGMTSAERNPTHTYTDSGAYTVSLTVMDSSGATTTTAKESFVVVGPSSVLKAEFTAKTRMSSEKTIVNFIDQGKGDITEWFWDFGDGSTSYEPNPMHIYTEPGAYTVTLTVTGSEGSDSDSKADFVHNIVGTVYVDNSFHWKPHYYSGSMIKFGKTILYTGSIKIPHEELRYSRIFYGGCNSSNYYVGTFNKGIMFFTVADMEDILADVYLEHYLLGETDDEILATLNDIEPIFEYYNFNLKPPSIDK